MKPKHELMQKMRAERKKAGLKRVEYWLTDEQKPKVDKYVARINR